MHQNYFLQIKNLSKSFYNGSDLRLGSTKKIKVLDNISLNILAGESLGLVGESGSGKTTLGKCIIRLIKSDQGSVIYEKENLLNLTKRRFHKYRSKFQMIFQNPDQAINPNHTINMSLEEPIKVILGYHGEILINKVIELLKLVGLDESILNCYPDQLSGGQKRRVSVARVLSVNPSFIIADEPTAALDAIFKRQILDLVIGLKQKLNLTLLLISHDWSVIKYATDRVAVMYHGKILEIGPTSLLINNSIHPYTSLLIQSAALKIGNSKKLVKNDQNNINAPMGCIYVKRCPFSEELCYKKEPELLPISNDRTVACHLAKEIYAKSTQFKDENKKIKM